MLDGRRAPARQHASDKARKAWELTHAGRYTELTDLLGGLVPDLETAARTAPENQRAEAFELLATTYQACSAALAKIGEPDAAWIAADRAMAAAERAGNPLLVAAGAFRLVFVFITARHYDQAEETARTAAAALWPKADQGDPQAMSLWGGLTLQRAIIAARINDADTAYGELERARQIAERLGRRAQRVQHRVRAGQRPAVRDRRRGRAGRRGPGTAHRRHRGHQRAVRRTAGPDAR